MGLTAILSLLVIALLVLVIRQVIFCARNREWKKLILLATGFLIFLAAIYYGFVLFITSM